MKCNARSEWVRVVTCRTWRSRRARRDYRVREYVVYYRWFGNGRRRKLLRG